MPAKWDDSQLDPESGETLTSSLMHPVIKGGPLARALYQGTDPFRLYEFQKLNQHSGSAGQVHPDHTHLAGPSRISAVSKSYCEVTVCPV